MSFAGRGTFTVTASSSLLPGTLTDLPVLVYVVDPMLKDVAHGGMVRNTCTFNGQTAPADVVFKTASNLASGTMSYDVEYWDGVTGTLIAWVRKTSCALSDLFYCGIGDASISTYQGGAVGAAYHSGILADWHFGDGTTLNLNDATANGYTLTNHGSWGAAAGKVGGGTALSVPGSSQYFSNASIATPSTIMVEFWNNVATGDHQLDAVFEFSDGSAGNGEGASPRLLSHAPFTDDTLYWDYSDATGSAGRVSTSYASYLDAWTHCLLVYDNATGVHAVYLNGAVAVTNTHSSSNPSLTGILINKNGANYGKRKLDEFRIYNAVPSSVANWAKAESFQYPASGFLSSSFAAFTGPAASQPFYIRQAQKRASFY